MFARIRSRMTFANVVSVIALFVALGLGTAWALERDSVRSRHIVNDQVKSVDVRDDSLPNGGLTGADILEGTLGKVPQADLLDGKDSAAFVTGHPATGTRIISFGNTDKSIPAASTPTGYLTIQENFPAFNWGLVDLGCDDTPGDHLYLRFINTTGETLDSYLDDGSGDPSFSRIPPFGQRDSPPKTHTPDLTTEHLVWQLVRDSGAVVTITASMRMQDTEAGTHCHAAMEAVARH